MHNISSKNLAVIIAEGIFPNSWSKREREQLLTSLSALVNIAKRETVYEFEDASTLADNFIKKIMRKA